MFKLLSDLFKAAPPSRQQINDLYIKLNSSGSIFYSDFTHKTTKKIKAAFKLSDQPTYLPKLIELSNRVIQKKRQLTAFRETLIHQQWPEFQENPITTIDREIYQTTMLLNIIELAINEHLTQLEAHKTEIENQQQALPMVIREIDQTKNYTHKGHRETPPPVGRRQRTCVRC